VADIRKMLEKTVRRVLAFYRDGDRLIDTPITQSCKAINANLDTDVVLNFANRFSPRQPRPGQRPMPWLVMAREELTAAGIPERDWQTELLVCIGLLPLSSDAGTGGARLGITTLANAQPPVLFPARNASLALALPLITCTSLLHIL